MRLKYFLIPLLSVGVMLGCKKDKVEPTNPNQSGNNSNNQSEMATWPVLMEADLDFVEFNQLDTHFKGKSFYNTGYTEFLEGMSQECVALYRSNPSSADGYSLHITGMLYVEGQYNRSIDILLKRKDGETDQFQTKTYNLNDPVFDVSFSLKSFDTLNTYNSSPNTEDYTYNGTVVDPTGSVTITSIDYSTNKVKGSFQFEAYTISINDNWEEIYENKVVVKNGIFEGKMVELN